MQPESTNYHILVIIYMILSNVRNLNAACDEGTYPRTGWSLDSLKGPLACGT
jgi:hypothetical protein